MAQPQNSKQGMAIAYAIQKRNQGQPVVNVQRPQGQPQQDGEMDHLHKSIGSMVDRIMQKRDEQKMAMGGLPQEDPNQDPGAEFERQTVEMAHGGQVLPGYGGDQSQGFDEDEFLDPAMQVAPDESDVNDVDNVSDPASGDEQDEQQKGKVDLNTIMRNLRKKHFGR